MRPDEARLIEGLRQGDAAAAGRFVSTYQPVAHRYFLAMTGRPEEAEDLTQETLVEAWRNLHTFEGRSSIGTWVMGIARNLFREWLRNRRPVESLAAVEATPDPGAARALEAAEMRVVLQRLPLEHREILALYYVQQFSCREIAGIVGLAAGTVQYRLHEARALLAKELGGDEPAGHGGDR
jgi:RNA polymerase sigma-70 factor (ECF subfamily)